VVVERDGGEGQEGADGLHVGQQVLGHGAAAVVVAVAGPLADRSRQHVVGGRPVEQRAGVVVEDAVAMVVVVRGVSFLSSVI